MTFLALLHIIDPNIIKKAILKEKYYRDIFNKEYDSEVFFNYFQQSKEKQSPIIIEIGFLLYFIIRKMEKHVDDSDKDYKKLIDLMPEEGDASESLSQNFIIEFILVVKQFFVLLFTLINSLWSRTHQGVYKFEHSEIYDEYDDMIRQELKNHSI